MSVYLYTILTFCNSSLSSWLLLKVIDVNATRFFPLSTEMNTSSTYIETERCVMEFFSSNFSIFRAHVTIGKATFFDVAKINNSHATNFSFFFCSLLFFRSAHLTISHTVWEFFYCFFSFEGLLQLEIGFFSFFPKTNNASIYHHAKNWASFYQINRAPAFSRYIQVISINSLMPFYFSLWYALLFCQNLTDLEWRMASTHPLHKTFLIEKCS